MKYYYLEKVDSTNKFAKDNLSNLDNMSIIYTSNQTNGKGRLGRKWNFQGADNIYATIVIKPETQFKEVYSNLTQYLCVILAQIFEEYGVNPQIKWPNDIRINSKKISGILAEAIIEKDIVKGLILGFGINLNCKKESLAQINQPATSLNIEIDKTVNKEEFLKKLVENFCLNYDKFINCGFPLIKDYYLAKAEFLNQEISVRVLDKVYTGIAVDITDDGALKLIDNRNNSQTLFIGDILWMNY